MNARERYLKTMLFGSPDRIPFEPGKPREKTLKRWHEEGLPAEVEWYDYLCGQIGIDAAMQVDPIGESGLVNFRMGVDKRKMSRGGIEIDAELRRLAPVIWDGGFIPGCDHGVPADVSWKNFVDYASGLAELTGWK
jgi:hypothetical protein